jgi:hypothetical protein
LLLPPVIQNPGSCRKICEQEHHGALLDFGETPHAPTLHWRFKKFFALLRFFCAAT